MRREDSNYAQVHTVFVLRYHLDLQSTTTNSEKSAEPIHHLKLNEKNKTKKTMCLNCAVLFHHTRQKRS